MPKQYRVQRTDAEAQEQVQEDMIQSQTSPEVSDLDAVLADIDTVLDEEAQDMVQGYVQQGGQ